MTNPRIESDTETAAVSLNCLARKPNAQLLYRVASARASVGDGLNDSEFTSFLQQRVLPAEAGFGFLSYSDGVVLLSVPPQDPMEWYPETGWIRPGKERIARAIATKFQWTFCEPPDVAPHFVRPSADSIHHHIELMDSMQTLVVAHPHYLKVRLYGSGSRPGYGCTISQALPLDPDLLRDLAALYE